MNGGGAMQRVRRSRVTCSAVRSASVLALFLAASAPADSQTTRLAPIPRATPPPESFFQLVNEQDRDVARKFYAKYIDVRGMPVVAAAVVDDAALQRTYTIVTSMLAGRPDILQALVKSRMYLIVIGKDQVYTDMPEYRNSPNPAYQNERVRGTGGRPTSFGEENLLTLPIDRYDDESIGVHEFCHTVDGALRSIDSMWTARRNAAHQNAREKGLYQWAYAQSNAGEYWGEICQTYFDTQRVNNWNHNFVGTREQLKEYDPIGYELARDAFNLTPENDWRYTPMRSLPNVAPPPAKFGIDPWYTKFTWAREFTVIGRSATDEALLRANDVIRKMFAYRHDILKALIADGVKLVVLGRGERISDLPEYNRLADKRTVDAVTRALDYSPAMKLLVVGEENVLGDPGDPRVGDNRVIRLFARALYDVTGHRAIDPNAGTVSPQQYELRVQRLDLRFGQKIRELHAAALQAGKWRGTSAMNDPAEYWVRGVLAYFDATGQHQAPLDTSQPIATREALQLYDPGLFGIVEETMAYKGKADWRLSRRQLAPTAPLRP